MSTNQGVSVSDLESIKRRLESERDVLIEKMRVECPEVYAFFESKKIDLKEIHKYSRQIAASLFMAGQLTASASGMIPTPAPVPPDPLAPPKITIHIQPSMDAGEEGLKVWNTYREYIIETSDKYGVEPQLIYATIMTESRGNPNSYRYEPRLGTASYGLGQILYTTALSLGYEGNPEGLYDPKTNIDLIGRYHKRSLDRWGEMDAYALTTAYNAGNPYGHAIPGHIPKFTKWYQTFQKNT
jgi:hypothetical protein